MFAHPYMRYLIAAVGVAAVVALGAYTYLTLKQAKYTHTGPIIISVVGTGEAVAVPDIAMFTFSVRAEADTAAEAQDESAESVNEILAYLKEQGIEDKDIKTLYYNLNPRYEYMETICNNFGYCPPGERILRGYEVNQSIEVKVRDTAKAGELISGVGTRGATDVSGLQFTIDDEEAIKAEAREKAIADAKTKADQLAEDLGVRIVRMTSFWENQPYLPFDGYGYGGRMESAVAQDASIAPNTPMGENTTTVQVNISYEVR
jgi:uncharacterized protein